MIFRSEPLDSRDDAHFVPSLGERFHQQSIRFVAAAVRWVIRRVVREQMRINVFAVPQQESTLAGERLS